MAARKSDGNGIPLTCDYVVTLLDGTRGSIKKIGRRWWLKMPRDKLRLTPIIKKVRRT